MSNLRQAAELALEALEAALSDDQPYIERCKQTRTALRAALAEPVQEPEGYFSIKDYGRWEENESEYGTPLYTAPPQRKPLTEAQVAALLENCIGSLPVAKQLIRAVEAAHGIKGEA